MFKITRLNKKYGVILKTCISYNFVVIVWEDVRTVTALYENLQLFR